VQIASSDPYQAVRGELAALRSTVERGRAESAKIAGRRGALAQKESLLAEEGDRRP
jgi:hypothetical protein